MDYLRLAQVLKPQGLRGEIKLKPFVDSLERFYDLEHVFLKRGSVYEKRQVFHARLYKQFAYLQIEGVEDRDGAEALRGQFLFVDRENAAPLEEGAHYIADLEGLEVTDLSGQKLGILSEVLQTGGVDVYCVEGEKSFRFPAVPHVVCRVDMDEKRMYLDTQRLQEVVVYD